MDIGKTIHPHPTLGESIGMAAEVALGSCTDVPPAKSKPLIGLNFLPASIVVDCYVLNSKLSIKYVS